MAEFADHAKQRVSLLEAQHAAVLAEFKDVLRFFGQPVPTDSTLRSTEPEQFLGVVWGLVDVLEAAARDADKVQECLEVVCSEA